ncbi:hypothetical protein P3T76_000067 [Phytophthora citrophthora]|uniref:Uncharacterized protein n=1 Tax=Phytophthora citrophthora TaxID=4793 RepID=A0AAD9GZX6_9STRA|nr:hypothetical protein P3T76_000067 [Phytophthora citrophthora]
MDVLMSWLERNGEEYCQSKRKIDMVEQLCEEMATNGIYGLSIATIRSQLCRLKSGVQMKAEGRGCNSLDVNRYYDRLLFLLFDDDERDQMHERATTEQETEPKASPVVAKSTTTAEKREIEKTSVPSTTKRRGGTVEASLPGTNSETIDPMLDTTEIRRRFELLCARQELQQRGIDPETIDTFLPLSHK